MSETQFLPAGYHERFKEAENYWERLSRIASSEESRLMCTHHHTRHSTTYVVYLYGRPKGEGFHHIKADTLCAMEVLNANNPPCFTCAPRGVLRGLLHNR